VDFTTVPGVICLGVSMQNDGEGAASARHFLIMAERAFSQARTNLEKARVLSELGETYIAKVQAVDLNAWIEVAAPPDEIRQAYALGTAQESRSPNRFRAAYPGLSGTKAFVVRSRRSQGIRLRNRCF
jgi:hypothetical protein